MSAKGTFSHLIFFNNSHIEAMSNDTNTTEKAEDEDLTERLSLGIQASMAFVGFIGNTLTFITLRKNGHIFASSVLKLMKNQAILDAIVCLLGSIYVLQPQMWKSHWSEEFDIFICHVSMHSISLRIKSKSLGQHIG